MKLSICLLAFCLTIHLSVISQTEDDKIKTLEAKATKFESDQGDIKKDIKNINNTLTELTTNVKSLKAGTDNELNLKKDKVKKRIDFVLQSSTYVSKCLASLNALNASLTEGRLLNTITSLNNPTNNELGFSLEAAIKDQIKILLKDKVKHEDATKINTFVSQLLNNPITQFLKTSVPVINNVVGFITNLSFNNKKISAEDLKGFLNGLSDYFEYYETLSVNNQELHQM